MFHTLSELQEKEKNKGRLTPKKSFPTMSKERSPEDNYYGKGNKAYDYYNKKPTESLNSKFEKTKNKITLVVFQNGFILDNGPFRDRAIPENNLFMEQVEKGNIPHELIDKGINDLGILLINRKSEIYHQPIPPITHITQITQINPINPITINPNPNAYNQYNNLDFLNQPGWDNLFNKYTYNYIQNTQSKYNSQYEQLINQTLYNNNNTNVNNNNGYNINNNNYNKYNNNTYDSIFSQYNQYNNNTYDSTFSQYNQYNNYPNPTQTPIATRNIRKDIFIGDNNNDLYNNIPKISNTVARNYNRYERHSSSVPKKDMKNKFETFHNFKRQELIKEEEEKKKKNQKRQIEPKDKETEKKEDKKKFVAFGGVGQAVGGVEIQGLNVQIDLKNSIDLFKPICTINIRLFNGEIAQGKFNYSQTLRDIYFYVRKISGSNNFTLLDGFPPRALRNYDMTIGQLKLENAVLTQRLNP